MNKFDFKIFNKPSIMLISLVISFILWFVVMNVSDPMTTRVISGVQVDRINEDAIEKEGMVYDVVSGDTVDVIVSGPRSVVEDMESGDIYAFADLSQVSVTNTALINVSIASGAYSKKTKDVKLTPKNEYMNLSIETSEDKTFQIKVITTGNVSEGCAVGVPVATPNMITVSGPASVLESINEVRAVVDVEGAEEEFTINADLGCVDAYGNAISKDSITLSDPSVDVTVPIYNTKEIPIKVSTKGNPEKGYGVKSVEYSPETIEIAGEEDSINALEGITVDDINISGATDNIETTQPLDVYLPEGVVIASSEDHISVIVKVEQYQTRNIMISSSVLTVEGQSDDYNYTFTSVDDTSIDVTGFPEDIEEITAESLKPTISVEGLNEGEREIEVKFAESDSYEIKGTCRFKVKITKKEAE